MRRLIIGGARSGKSTYAESLLRGHERVTYLATSARNDDDPEWSARIAAHEAQRPADWATVETLDIGGVLAADDDAPVLVDCLTVWLSRVLDEQGCWDDPPPPDALTVVGRRVDALASAVAATRRDVVLVTNEVGQGVVPASASGRLFRDQMGLANQAVARACDEVWLLVAGCPLRLK